MEREEEEFGLAAFPVSLLLAGEDGPGRGEVGPGGGEDGKCNVGGLAGGLVVSRRWGRGRGWRPRSGACNGVERIEERRS
jgi:hypothetical protein